MKKALLLLLALCCLTLPAQAADFYDLPVDHWAAEPIRRAVEAGVMVGYGDGSFQPGRNVTASQFCAILSRSFLKEAFDAAPEGEHRAMDACLPVLKGTGVKAAYKAEGTERILILTGVDYEKDAYTACGLKRNGKVKWSDWGPISGLVDGSGFTTVYKRW